MTTAEDPGWRGASKGLLFACVPMLGARMAVRADNGLVLMRQAWVSFAAVATMVWVPVIGVWSVDGLVGSLDGRTVALAVIVIGVVLQLVAANVVKPASGDDIARVRAQVQRSFFIRVAFAESAVLVGFIGFILTVNPMVYAAGYVVALAGLSDAAPTAAKISRMQDDLRSSGSEIHLLAAMVGGGLTR